MNLRTLIVVIGVLCIGFGISSAQEHLIAPSGIFSDAIVPAPTGTPFPSSAGFIKINLSVMLEAASRKNEIFTIENFPLGQSRVTLAVDQFDVLNKSSRLVLGTTHGDVVTTAPTYVLLHGSVVGDANSHVYIAVFKTYAIGYIETSKGASGESSRYLIQPTGITKEQLSTMIVYKENELQRLAPLDHQWTCGTDELPANGARMQKMFDEMAKPVPEANPQTRMVHLLNIAIDCDHEFYQTLGSDAVRAQEYAIAVLGAQSDIYLRDLWCGVNAGYLRVWVNDDPYPGDGTGELLGQIVDYWNTTMINTQRAAMMLYSSHGGGGLAYVGTLCSPNDGGLGYGVCGLNTGVVFPADGYIWDVDVSSHEFGHICGSSHTHNCGWNPAVDSCVGAEGTCYANPKPVRGTIMSYCHLTSFGTELKFHPRVAKYLKTIFSKPGTCSQYVEQPVAGAGPDRVICPGSSVSLGQDIIGGSAPYSYTWRPATGLSSTNDEIVTATPTATTTYITSVTDGNYLRSYDTVTVIVQTPTVNAGGDVTTCGLGIYSLSGSATGYGPFHFKWVDPITGKILATKAIVDVPITSTASYKLIVTDSFGCINSALTTITVVPKPKPSFRLSGPTEFCAGDSITISTSQVYGTYRWSNGMKTPSITVGTSGKYYVVVQNAGLDCIDSTTALEITVFPKPPKPILTQHSDSLFCSDAVTYQWYRNDTVLAGATTGMLVPNMSGQYSVRVRNEQGCESKSDMIAYIHIDHSAEVISPYDSKYLRLYPNPASDQLTMEYSREASSILDLNITDILGHQVYAISKKNINAQGKLLFDLRAFPSGSYILHYSFGDDYHLVKFVKK